MVGSVVGHKISASEAKNCPCDDCKSVAKTGEGSCDRCKYTAGKMFKSPVAYALAKGTLVSREKTASCPKSCGDCNVAFKDSKQCKKCKVGFVAGRMFTKDADYQSALVAYKTLQKSVAASKMCEDCAVALVMDGNCDKCNVKFKDGQVARRDG